MYPVVEVSLVVPVFNEVDIVRLFMDRVRQVFDANASGCVEIIFVNDGSTDDTLERLLHVQQSDHRVRIVDLSRNVGKEAALTTGLQATRGWVVVPIDMDLQDPPGLVSQMIACWREGYDVVLGRRVARDTDTWTKRVAAQWFYRVHNWVVELAVPENVDDFRLMDRVIVDVLNDLPESRRFMQGLFARVGFRTTTVDDARPPRAGCQQIQNRNILAYMTDACHAASTGLPSPLLFPYHLRPKKSCLPSHNLYYLHDYKKIG
jgi:polyisoprenyl-phosphate glycosyltransferase